MVPRTTSSFPRSLLLDCCQLEPGANTQRLLHGTQNNSGTDENTASNHWLHLQQPLACADNPEEIKCHAMQCRKAYFQKLMDAAQQIND